MQSEVFKASLNKPLGGHHSLMAELGKCRVAVRCLLQGRVKVITEHM
jgi:hypothetical protein